MGLKDLVVPLCCSVAKIECVVSSQGHYRYCEALFSLGEVQMAIHANNLAMNLCQYDKDGFKDLEKQYLKFICHNGGFKGISQSPSKHPVSCVITAPDLIITCIDQ